MRLVHGASSFVAAVILHAPLHDDEAEDEADDRNAEADDEVPIPAGTLVDKSQTRSSECANQVDRHEDDRVDLVVVLLAEQQAGDVGQRRGNQRIEHTEDEATEEQNRQDLVHAAIPNATQTDETADRTECKCNDDVAGFDSTDGDLTNSHTDHAACLERTRHDHEIRNGDARRINRNNGLIEGGEVLRLDAADVEHAACKDEYPEVPFAISLLCRDTGKIEMLSIDDLALGDRSTICLQAAILRM